jgi:hypothetical protein
LCGARDLIIPLLELFKKLNLGLAMREHSQQALNQQVRQRIRDYGYNDRKQQRMSAVGSWARYDPAERSVKRIADGYDELNEPGAASRGQQREQESHSEQRIDYQENVIDNLRNSRHPSRPLHFAFSVNDLVYSLRTKVARNFVNLLRLAARRFRGGAIGDLGVYVAFDPRLYRLVLRGTARFIDS